MYSGTSGTACAGGAKLRLTSSATSAPGSRRNTKRGRVAGRSNRSAVCRRPVSETEAPMPDAVVIGAGPNGLVAANLLADAGWTVEVLEAQDRPGGAVKSGELVEPGFINDQFSGFYPLAAASPA